MTDRKGNSALDMVLKIALGLIVLLIGLYLVMNVPRWIGGATSCTDNGGRCVPSGELCGEGYYTSAAMKCSTPSEVCCAPLGASATLDYEMELSKEQREALQNPILLTLGNDNNALSALPLKVDGEEGKAYDIHVAFKSAFPPMLFGPVAIYVTEASSSGTVFKFKSDGSGIDQVSEAGKELDYKAKGIVNLNDEYLDPTKDQLRKDKKSTTYYADYKYRPKLLDSYSRYALNVKVLHKLKIYCVESNIFPDQQKEWLQCLQGKDKDGKDINVSKDIDPMITKLDEGDLRFYFNDPQYTLVEQSFPITVSRLIDIKDISRSWVAEDKVTLQLADPAYSDVEVKLVDGSSKDFAGILEECANNKDFKSTLHFVDNWVLHTSGFPITLEIGGFKIPTSSSAREYKKAEQKIVMAKGKGEIKVDEATLKEDFGYKDEVSTGISNAVNTGTAFLCARAKKPKTDAWTYSAAEEPLHVDIQPPAVSKDSIKVFPPEPLYNRDQIVNHWNDYPSTRDWSYFYTDYPRIVFNCDDHGQSGCVSYDYYLKTGNFVDIDVTTDNWKVALGSVALNAITNQMLQYFASKSAETTICPFLFSNEFRRNTQREIRIRDQGQGIICVRMMDKAGNAALVWSAIYTPAQMIERLAEEAAAKAAQEAAAAADAAAAATQT